jgi:hypothetical protein
MPSSEEYKRQAISIESPNPNPERIYNPQTQIVEHL